MLLSRFIIVTYKSILSIGFHYFLFFFHKKTAKRLSFFWQYHNGLYFFLLRLGAYRCVSTAATAIVAPLLIDITSCLIFLCTEYCYKAQPSHNQCCNNQNGQLTKKICHLVSLLKVRLISYSIVPCQHHFIKILKKLLTDNRVTHIIQLTVLLE